MRYIKWIFCLLLAIPTALSAQEKEVLSLQEILHRIDTGNLMLKVYGNRAESFKYSADAATAWMPPMVGLGTWQTPYPGQKVMDDRDKGMLMLRIEQEIPDRSKLNARRNYIASQGNVELAGRGVYFNQLRTEAKKQYYAWMVALQKTKVLQKNEQVLAMMRKIEEVRFPFNQSQLSSVYRSDAAIEDNRAMIEMQQGEIGRARAYLNAMMNRPGEQDFSIDTAMAVEFIPARQIDTASIAGTRQDVLQMNESIRSMQLNIQAMELQRRPDFRLQFDHMSPVGKMMPQAFGIMGMVSIPIVPWASKMYKSDIRAMTFNIRAMETERAAMLQETQGMLYGMQAEIRSMQKRISTIENRVIPALQKTFDANFIVYQENKLSITALLDSWEALNMMQLDLLDEKQRLYLMITDYEKEIFR
jgi:outer membrane protein, heavy metal efflux system